MKNKQRLINAPTYRQILEQEKKYPGRTQEFIDAIEVAIADLTDMPTVDAVEVVHGRWIKFQFLGYEPMYECSVCGKLHDQDYNFCNNCGAKMDGGNGE